ncbi:iron chelate uptake ABC transporter family permease subunit, partial [bacterium]|nr:iron chelate uptake ABC transporter family permease subunit [bacterium]
NLMLVSVSLATGIAVSLSGPIGFVGLMAPHICRLLVGSGHRMLIPATIFFGGSFLVACDTIARTVVAPTEIPVGVVTSLVGSVFFLWLLIKRD